MSKNHKDDKGHKNKKAKQADKKKQQAKANNKKKEQVKQEKQKKSEKKEKEIKEQQVETSEETAAAPAQKLPPTKDPKIFNIPNLRNSDKVLRIGMLTSGGDCQALNATMRGVVKGLFSVRDNVEIYGFQHGYKGLIYSDFKMYTARDFSGILTQGGTILGTSRMPFKEMRIPDKNGLDKVEAMKQNYYKLQLDCLVMLGGNGSTKSANMLSEEGLNVVSLPKTIDNDLWATDYTFGFQALWMWPRRRSTGSTRPRRPTTGSSWWRSWAMMWAGSRCTPAWPAARISCCCRRSPTTWMWS